MKKLGLFFSNEIERLSFPVGIPIIKKDSHDTVLSLYGISFTDEIYIEISPYKVNN